MELSNLLKQPLAEIEQRLLDSIPADFPSSLRLPIHDFLQLPSKKIRPLLALFACEAVGGSPEQALPAAAAVELFHDFTLIHDDIMDQDELRRGFPTLHVKYDASTAILAGDALIGLAFRELLQSPAQARYPAAEIFTEALVKVCEGQALDKEFENRRDVTLPEYLDMIAKKTAWLIQASCALGALCGEGSEAQIEHLSKFGYNLGMGFQIQDDLLDFIADESKLGKKVGSDFRMHKTTYVTLKYRELVAENPQFQQDYPADPAAFSDLPAFREALQKVGVIEAGHELANHYIETALSELQQVTPPDSQNPLYVITHFLRRRQY